MGRPDSAVMKEKMTAAMDESLPVDERVEALDDLEMVSSPSCPRRLCPFRPDQD